MKIDPFECEKHKPKSNDHIYDDKMRLRNIENLNKLLNTKRNRGIPNN